MPHDDPPSADEDVAQFRLDHRNTDLATLVDHGFVIWDHDENIVKKGPQFDTNSPSS